MATNYKGEIWKPIKIELGQTKGNRLEVSNFGRIRSFNLLSDGNILNGSMVNGYKIIRLKFFLDREESLQRKLDYQQKQIAKFSKKITEMKLNKASKTAIKEATSLLENLKSNLKAKYAQDTKERTINYHSLVHRLVATYFLKKPTSKETVVGHINYDKLNNKASNLKWMTIAENQIHQQSSPYVIAENATRRESNRTTRTTKLSVTKVMLLKKLLLEGKAINKLAKQFKVSDTQIIRIKRNENWGDVPAAK
jgi:HNH endonuclease/NUMOD4 motif